MADRATDRAGLGAASLLAPPAVAAINHLLRSASWARAQLKPFAGKTVQFRMPPLNVALSIQDNGEVGAATTTGVDAKFTLTPGIALRVLGGDASAWRAVEAEGDTALAREILVIAQNLRWDAEEDLSRLFGDIVAHRMVLAANELKRWQRDTADSFARSAAAYWTEEQPLIATRQDVERYVRDVDALRDDIARIEKRIEQLQRNPHPH
jgi:ubiquinone biosynthesis accessory factor UbiJ